MHERPFFETREGMECPECGEAIPLQTDVCPHCPIALQ